MFDFIILLYVNIIIITTNYLLVPHISTCVGDMQVVVKHNNVFGCLFCLHVSQGNQKSHYNNLNEFLTEWMYEQIFIVLNMSANKKSHYILQ